MKFNPLSKVLLLCFLVAMGGLSATEGARLALVLGNAAYEGDAALKNPVNDATDVAAALKTAGWQVTLVTDSDRKGMRNAVNSWRDQLSLNPGSSALFYYAGHGTQIDGANYLMPVKTLFETLDDVKDDALNLTVVTNAIEEAESQVSLIILDACRDNPFAKKGTRSLSGTRGLSVVQSGGGAKGSAIMFSTSPGDVAQDGSGRNGVFTAALLKNIGNDVRIEDMFRKVTAEVRQVTVDKQKPWINASLSSDFYLLSEQIRQGRAAEVAAQASVAAQKATVERQAEMDALAERVRTAEAGKAEDLKKQLEVAKREADAAKAAQAQAASQAAALAAEAAKPKGKVRFESSDAGSVYWGSQLLGSVGPNSPLFADTLGTGNQEFRFEKVGFDPEVKKASVTTAAYSTVFFGKVPEGGTGSGISTISVNLDPAQTGNLAVRARPLADTASTVIPVLLTSLAPNQSVAPLETATNFVGDEVALTAATNVVGAGSWLVSARLAGDFQDSWYKVTAVKAGGDVSLSLPVIDYSVPFQIFALNQRKGEIEPKLRQAAFPRFATNLGGWVLAIPGGGFSLLGAFSGFAWIFMGTNSAIVPAEKQGAATGFTTGLGLGLVLSALALWTFSLDAPNVELDRELNSLNETLKELSPSPGPRT